ncbi:hypothetical protein ACQEVF_53830 [Nonomuraea polychroma]
MTGVGGRPPLDRHLPPVLAPHMTGADPGRHLLDRIDAREASSTAIR